MQYYDWIWALKFNSHFLCAPLCAISLSLCEIRHIVSGDLENTVV